MNLPQEAFLRRIQKFIPKHWKQNVKQSKAQNKPSATSLCSQETFLYSFTPYDESMLDSILTSLRHSASQGHLAKAFRSFSLIQLHTSSSASCEFILFSISSLLSSCTDFKSLPLGKQLHAQIVLSGLLNHPALVPRLVTFYSAFNSLVDAHYITETSNILHPLPWNLLISSYLRTKLYKEALSAYEQMVNKGIRPDNFTYPSILKACGEESNFGFGKEVHKSINASGWDRDLFVQNSLISMYAKCGEVEVAREIFDQMPKKDSVSWNSMISAYASRGVWAEAFELFGSMQANNIEVNIIVLNTIAGGFLRTGNCKGTLELLSQMRHRGTQLDSVALLIGLGACSDISVLSLGMEIHGLAIRNWCSGCDNVRNALITMYSRCKDFRHANVVFRLAEAKSIITWNSIISGHTHWDQPEEASFLFREMLSSGVEPNEVTIASILPLCARVANLQHGKEFHCYITRREQFKEYLLLWNALVDMYSRSGKISIAKRLFNLLSQKDEVTYTSLIAGHAIQGEGRAAIELFEEMIRFHIKPDHVTMVAILSACSHSGLLVQGQVLFEKMSSVYGITPRLEHYACMVDLYGRAGFLKKAEAIFARMPYKPTPAMWATLIGACRIHGNTILGQWAAENLLKMRPQNSGYYVLIANMYAAAGCWNKLASVRTFMRDLGVQKATGCAWVDIGAGFSTFSVGDTSYTEADELYPLLWGLTKQMKDAGYVACEDLDNSWDEEESAQA